MRAIVTGSTGFVGRSLMARLGTARALHLSSPDWREALQGIDFSGSVVFHLAARVHQPRGSAGAWVHDNVDKTEALALAAARGGARRFVFASTIKVHGEETASMPFRPEDPFAPEDHYARSKALAEERLRAIASTDGLDVVTVRSPLVFGRGAKANLRAVLRLCDSAWPLPFAATDNRRSWIHVADLCELLLACGEKEAAAGRAFIAAHATPFSTPQLMEGLRERLHRARRLFAVPAGLLETMASLTGQGQAMRRLTRSLEGDASASVAFGWQARRSFSDALGDLAAGATTG